MSEQETQILEIMRGGIRKFNNFLDQIPDEFFGLQASSKEELQKQIKTRWQDNPYQTPKQIVDSLLSDIVNDITCPDANALKQILTIGVNSDFAPPELPEKPVFLGEMSKEDLEGKTIIAKPSEDVN
ncbi:MAG: hypothetical protein NT034_02180 [Candidatus Magasanikbacteria bacterium]|nr:hypothetical protein [Candidatus Magasanikbacteria bacterium]